MREDDMKKVEKQPKPTAIIMETQPKRKPGRPKKQPAPVKINNVPADDEETGIWFCYEISPKEVAVYKKSFIDTGYIPHLSFDKASRSKFNEKTGVYEQEKYDQACIRQDELLFFMKRVLDATIKDSK